MGITKKEEAIIKETGKNTEKHNVKNKKELGFEPTLGRHKFIYVVPGSLKHALYLK